MTALNYNTGIKVGGVDPNAQNKLNALPTTAPRTAQQGMMNLPAYMRKRGATPQQMREREDQNQDSYRSALASGKVNLGRMFSEGNAQQNMASLGAASQASNNYFNTMMQGLQGQRQNEMTAAMGQMQQQQQMMPLLSQVFGGGMGGGWW